MHVIVLCKYKGMSLSGACEGCRVPAQQAFCFAISLTQQCLAASEGLWDKEL